MPKVKPSDNEQMNREIRAAIYAGQERQGLSNKLMAKILGISEQTYRQKVMEPDRFSVAQFRIVARRLKFADDDMIRMMRPEAPK